MDFGEIIGYGPAGPSFWLGPVTTGGEAHIALAAADRAAVEAFHDAAVARAAEVLHAPEEWPEYYAGHYGAFGVTPTATTSRRCPTTAESTCLTGNLMVLSL